MVGERLHIETPLVRDRTASVQLNKNVYLKMECAQPTGSFKLRGIGLLCQREAKLGAKAFVSSSGGNAGLAVAYAGRLLHVPVTVVVPTTTPQSTRHQLEACGARVFVSGSLWDDADAAARSIAKSESASYIPPFDHPTIWEGHSTIIDEIANEQIRPDAVVVAVGGGGLMCGLLEGMRRHGWLDVTLVTVGTVGADCLHKSIEHGGPIVLPAITSLAKSLGAARVSDEAFAWTARHPVKSVVVTDQSAVDACFYMADQHRVLVEPACGAAVSLACNAHECLQPFQVIVVVACGGVGVTIPKLLEWRAELRAKLNCLFL